MEDLRVLDRYWICNLGHINDGAAHNHTGLCQQTTAIKRCVHCGSSAAHGLGKLGRASKTAQPSYPLWYAYLETNVTAH